MLPEKEIAQALHADRVVPVLVYRPHGPLGLEQLAAAVSQLNLAAGASGAYVRRAVALKQQTWQKLGELAETSARKTSQHVTASQIAATILEQYVAAISTKSGAGAE